MFDLTEDALDPAPQKTSGGRAAAPWCFSSASSATKTGAQGALSRIRRLPIDGREGDAQSREEVLARWPSARIAMRTASGGWRSERRLVVRRPQAPKPSKPADTRSIASRRSSLSGRRRRGTTARPGWRVIPSSGVETVQDAEGRSGSSRTFSKQKIAVDGLVQSGNERHHRLLAAGSANDRRKRTLVPAFLPTLGRATHRAALRVV